MKSKLNKKGSEEREVENRERERKREKEYVLMNCKYKDINGVEIDLKCLCFKDGIPTLKFCPNFLRKSV